MTREGATVADAVIRLLHEAGVAMALGGGQLLGLYEAMRRAILPHILVRHVQSAGFAAIGYARVTDICALAIGTTGPGITNMVTRVAEAFTGSVPMLALAGQVDSTDAESYRGYLHELAAQDATFRTIARSCLTPRTPDTLPKAIEAGRRAGLRPPPGPAYVEVPVDLLVSPSPDPPCGVVTRDDEASTRSDPPVIILPFEVSPPW